MEEAKKYVLGDKLLPSQDTIPPYEIPGAMHARFEYYRDRV